MSLLWNLFNLRIKYWQSLFRWWDFLKNSVVSQCDKLAYLKTFFSACQRICQDRVSRSTTPIRHSHNPRPTPPSSCYSHIASPMNNDYTPPSSMPPPSPGYVHQSPAHFRQGRPLVFQKVRWRGGYGLNIGILRNVILIQIRVSIMYRIFSRKIALPVECTVAFTPHYINHNLKSLPQ